MNRKKLNRLLIVFGLILMVTLVVYTYSLEPTYIPASDTEIQEELRVEFEGETFGVHLGDAFLYRIAIIYNPRIVKLEKISLDQSVDFNPFIVRKFQEKEQVWMSPLKRYIREYELQLLSGQVNKLYTFPTIIVAYQNLTSGENMVKKVVPMPVYVSARLPEDVRGLTTKPLKGELINITLWRMPLLLLGLGGFFGITGLVLLWRRKRQAALGIANEWLATLKILDLLEQLAPKSNPGTVYYQLHQLLTILLIDRFEMNLMEPSFEGVPVQHRTKLTEILTELKRTYRSEPIPSEEAAKIITAIRAVVQSLRGQDPEMSVKNKWRLKRWWKN